MAKQNSNGKFLSRGAILAAEDLEFSEVHVDEWGGTVRIREMNGKEKAVFQKRVFMAAKEFGIDPRELQRKGSEELNVVVLAMDPDLIPLICQWVIVDEKGQSVFQKDDLDRLASKNIKPLQEIFLQAFKMSEEPEVETVDGDLGKASVTTISDAPPSG